MKSVFKNALVFCAGLVTGVVATAVVMNRVHHKALEIQAEQEKVKEPVETETVTTEPAKSEEETPRNFKAEWDRAIEESGGYEYVLEQAKAKWVDPVAEAFKANGSKGMHRAVPEGEYDLKDIEHTFIVEDYDPEDPINDEAECYDVDSDWVMDARTRDWTDEDYDAWKLPPNPADCKPPHRIPEWDFETIPLWDSDYYTYYGDGWVTDSRGVPLDPRYVIELFGPEIHDIFEDDTLDEVFIRVESRRMDFSIERSWECLCETTNQKLRKEMRMLGHEFEDEIGGDY